MIPAEDLGSEDCAVRRWWKDWAEKQLDSIDTTGTKMQGYSMFEH